MCINVLGLSNESSSKKYNIDEIKQAYRKKVLEVHPDKPSGNNTDFVKVQNAYDFLVGSETNDCSFTDENHENTIKYMNIMFSILKNFSNIMKFVKENFNDDKFEEMKTKFKESNDKNENNYKMRNEKNYKMRNENPNLRLTISVTLNELYVEHGKKITIRYIDKGNIMRKRLIFFPFSNYVPLLVYEGLGDWNTKEECYGDVTITLNILENEDYIINSCINSLDLLRAFSISVSDYYTKFTLTFDHFGETISLTHTPYLDGSEIILEEKGLHGKKYINEGTEDDLKNITRTRGDLYIIFNVDFKSYNPSKYGLDIINEIFPSLL
jgi:DnaJ-class molecular chaperone